MKKEYRAIHLFLFAVYPVLHLYSVNIGKVFFADAVPAAVVLLGITFFAYLAVKPIFKSSTKAALSVSLFLVLFFSYGSFFYGFPRIFQVFPEYKTFHFRHRELLLIWTTLFCGGVFFIYRSNHPKPFSKILDMVSLFLVSIVLINIAVYFSAERYFGGDGIPGQKKYLESAETTLPPAAPSAADPDIYCIILDEYAGLKQISEIYDYDNTAFARRLTDKGFYIAAKSRTKFKESEKSISSLLNMGASIEDKNLIRDIRDNKVVHILKSRGYKYIHIGSWDCATSRNENADINYNGYFLKNEFNSQLVNMTVLLPFITQGCLLRGGIFYTFDKLAGAVDIKGPKFVFAHIMCPHSPYLFDKNGQRISPVHVSDHKNKSFYLGQYIYVTAKMENIIDLILARSKIPPVIIIQSDHGVRDKPGLDAGDPFDIFNAYYLPGGAKKDLYQSISPANSFRAIFNYYFGAKYDLLPE